MSIPENQSLSSHSDLDVPPDPNSEGRSEAGTVRGDSSASRSSGSRDGERVHAITFEAEMAQHRTKLAEMRSELAAMRTERAAMTMMRTELAGELAEMRKELAKKDDTISELEDDLLTKSFSACFPRLWSAINAGSYSGFACE